jgi:hypothetical protein
VDLGRGPAFGADGATLGMLEIRLEGRDPVAVDGDRRRATNAA